MRIFAFIFVRGGSKGLPRKNVRLLNHKPLLCYSIETALAVPEIEKIFVSTEDDEIARVAAAAGAIVIDRPSELATDTSVEWLAWQHAVQWVHQHIGPFDMFVSLPATSPLRAVSDVQAAIKQLNSSEADICITVTPASRNPYFNMVKSRPDGFVEVVCDSSGFNRRQDAPKLYDITTVAYATTPSFILNANRVFDGRVVSIEVPKHRAVDIDDIDDFLFAEFLLKRKADAPAE